MTDGADGFGGDMRVKSTAKSGQVQVPVDTAELLACFGYPAAHQRSAMVPDCQFFTLREWVRAMEIIDSMLFVRATAQSTATPPPHNLNQPDKHVRFLWVWSSWPLRPSAVLGVSRDSTPVLPSGRERTWILHGLGWQRRR